jgi:hypothetical protein
MTWIEPYLIDSVDKRREHIAYVVLGLFTFEDRK